MKKTYYSPITTLFTVNTSAIILAGSGPIGIAVSPDDASTEDEVLSRKQFRYATWGNEEEDF